jgi:predicted nucleic acid-binding protein
VNVLVDTCVWSLALRRKPQDLNTAESSAVSELAELIRDGRARIIGVIRQELLSGIRTPKQFEQIRVDLSQFPDEPINSADHEAAAKANNECRSKGIVVSVVDILICAIAQRRDWSIFTTDPDFSHFGKVLPIKLHSPRR